MADKSCQPNAEQEKSCHTTEHFPQHGVVDELCVDHTGADESRQKKNDRFHHAPKNNRGDDCPVSHGQAVHQLLAFLANHFGRLPANGISFLFKHTSGVLADSHPACLMKGRDSLVRCGQGFRKSVFKLFHLLIKNADDLAVVLLYNGCPIFLLHLFSSRNCHIYF